jgi:hypothetical protein
VALDARALQHVAGAHSRLAQHVVTVSGHGQCTQCGAVLDGEPVVQVPQQWRENDP